MSPERLGESAERLLIPGEGDSEPEPGLFPKDYLRRELVRRFKGLHIPLSTVWDAEGNIDVEAQGELCRRAALRADGLFAGGTSGLGGNPCFRTEYTATLVGVIYKVRKEQGREGDLLIEGGAYGPTAKKATDFANAGYNASADLAVVPPLYLKYNPETADVKLPVGSKEAMDEATLQFYLDFAGETNNRPFVVYNIPGACFGGYAIPPELFGRILVAVPGVIGIKDSSRNGEVTQAYIRVARQHAALRGENVNVLSGFFPTKNALLGPTPEFDARGGVPIEANLLELIPPVLWQAALARDGVAVEKIQVLAQEFLDWIVGGIERKEFPELATGTAYALSLKGIGGGYMPPGQRTLPENLYDQIRTIMERFADERQLLIEAGIPMQYINEAEEIIAERKARAAKTPS